MKTQKFENNLFELEVKAEIQRFLKEKFEV